MAAAAADMPWTPPIHELQRQASTKDIEYQRLAAADKEAFDFSRDFADIIKFIREFRAGGLQHGEEWVQILHRATQNKQVLYAQGGFDNPYHHFSQAVVECIHSATWPEGWEAHVADDGRTYYVDHETQATQWESPVPTASGNFNIGPGADVLERFSTAAQIDEVAKPHELWWGKEPIDNFHEWDKLLKVPDGLGIALLKGFWTSAGEGQQRKAVKFVIRQNSVILDMWGESVPGVDALASGARTVEMTTSAINFTRFFGTWDDQILRFAACMITNYFANERRQDILDTACTQGQIDDALRRAIKQMLKPPITEGAGKCGGGFAWWSRKGVWDIYSERFAEFRLKGGRTALVVFLPIDLVGSEAMLKTYIQIECGRQRANLIAVVFSNIETGDVYVLSGRPDASGVISGLKHYKMGEREEAVLEFFNVEQNMWVWYNHETQRWEGGAPAPGMAELLRVAESTRPPPPSSPFKVAAPPAEQSPAERRAKGPGGAAGAAAGAQPFRSMPGEGRKWADVVNDRFREIFERMAAAQRGDGNLRMERDKHEPWGEDDERHLDALREAITRAMSAVGHFLPLPPENFKTALERGGLWGGALKKGTIVRRKKRNRRREKTRRRIKTRKRRKTKGKKHAGKKSRRKESRQEESKKNATLYL